MPMRRNKKQRRYRPGTLGIDGAGGFAVISRLKTIKFVLYTDRIHEEKVLDHRIERLPIENWVEKNQ